MTGMLSGGQLAADGGGGVSAGTLAFIVITLLALATYLLIRSMNAQLRKVPESFEPQSPEEEQPINQPDAEPRERGGREERGPGGR